MTLSAVCVTHVCPVQFLQCQSASAFPLFRQHLGFRLEPVSALRLWGFSPDLSKTTFVTISQTAAVKNPLSLPSVTHEQPANSGSCKVGPLWSPRSPGCAGGMSRGQAVWSERHAVPPALPAKVCRAALQTASCSSFAVCVCEDRSSSQINKAG